MQVRETILPHVATLGYGPKFVQILERVTPHDPHGVLASCCVRLLYQFSDSKSIVKSIAAQCEQVKPIQVLMQTMIPMHKDAAFTIETVRKMLEQNSVKMVSSNGEGGNDASMMSGSSMSIGGSDEHASALVREALDKEVDLITFLTSLLEGTVAGGDKLGSEVRSLWLCSFGCVFLVEKTHRSTFLSLLHFRTWAFAKCTRWKSCIVWKQMGCMEPMFVLSWMAIPYGKSTDIKNMICLCPETKPNDKICF